MKKNHLESLNKKIKKTKGAINFRTKYLCKTEKAGD
jgi:hypothetical protein